MIIHILDLKGSEIVLDIENGTSISKIKELISNKWNMGTPSYKLFHNQRELKNEETININDFYTNPVLVLFNKDLYMPVHHTKCPEIDEIKCKDENEAFICDFLKKCSNQPRFGEMLRNIIDDNLNSEPISIIMESIQSGEADESLASAFFCATFKNAIYEVRSFFEDIE